MNCDRNFATEQKQPELQAIASAVLELAEKSQGNSLAVLALLRTLEHLHREIREGVFQASLPDNRQKLYALIRDIEEQGGWPYIDRQSLGSLLVYLEDGSPPTPNPDSKPQP